VPAVDIEPINGSPAFDAARYREHVDDLDLTEEQKAAFLKTLWEIMVAFVDLGFRADSVSVLLLSFNEASSTEDSDALEERGQNCANAFDAAAKKGPAHEP
jgi:hypothetical protein